MAWLMFGAKPLPKSIMNHYLLNHWEQTSVTFEVKYREFLHGKVIWKCFLKLITCEFVDTLRPGDVYMRLWTGSSLVQVIAWCQEVVKPLPEPMLSYCHLDHHEQMLGKFEWKYNDFPLRKYIWKCHLKMSAILFRSQCVNHINICFPQI